MSIEVRPMSAHDVDAAAALQALAFPPPFPQDLLWQPEHLRGHLEVFPEGQFVAVEDGHVVGSCSNTRIGQEAWSRHDGWTATVGGPMLDTFEPAGGTLYGLDVTVHPGHRRRGAGRRLYEARFMLVRDLGLDRYGTGCRMPDFGLSGFSDPAAYAQAVVAGDLTDRTLTPLLRYRLSFLGVIQNYMEDHESGNAAALLEWQP